jgi:hypothetical protein
VDREDDCARLDSWFGLGRFESRAAVSVSALSDTTMIVVVRTIWTKA